MPIYEFYCDHCSLRREELRRLADYTEPECNVCGGAMFHVVSAPTISVWNQDRRFPNVTKTGDGSMSFSSKTDYECHLKENHMAESSTDAPVKTPHGAEVFKYGSREAQSS